VAPPPLTREQIAVVALEYADEHGLEALSMRRLAEELSVGTMTLYGHFRSKHELLNAAVAVAVADEEPPPPGGDWRPAITQLALAARATLTRHPSLIQIRATQPVLRPEALHLSEAGLRILEDAGFPPDEATKAFRLLFTFVFGFALFSPEASSADAREVARAALSGLPTEYYPRLSRAVDEAAEAMGGDAVFEYALERIVDGLEARLAALGRADGRRSSS
jgi:AcrR family transcriptional regulator